MTKKSYLAISNHKLPTPTAASPMYNQLFLLECSFCTGLVARARSIV